MNTHFFKAAVCLFFFLGVGATAQSLCDQYTSFLSTELTAQELDGLSSGTGTLELTINGEVKTAVVHLAIGPGHGVQELSPGNFISEDASAYLTLRFEDGSAFTAFGSGHYRTLEPNEQPWGMYFTVDLKHGAGKFKDAEGRLAFTGVYHQGAPEGRVFGSIEGLQGWICGEDDRPTRLVKRR